MGSCFWPSGDVADNYFACPNSHVCCEAGDYCLAGGLCEDQYDYFYRGGCTSKEWSGDSACPQYCMNQTVPWLDSMVRKVSVLNCVLDANGTNSKEFACVNEHYESVCQDLANANAPFEVFEVTGAQASVIGTLVGPLTQTKASTSASSQATTSSSASTTATTSSGANTSSPSSSSSSSTASLTSNSGLPTPSSTSSPSDSSSADSSSSSSSPTPISSTSSTPTVPIAVGVSVGCIALIIALIAFFLLRRRKKQKKASVQVDVNNNTTSQNPPAYTNSTTPSTFMSSTSPKSFNTLSPPPISVPSRPSSAYSAELHGNDKHFSELHGNDRQVSEMPNWEWLARDRRFRYELDGDSDIVSAPLRMGAKAAGNAAARPSTPATGSSTPAQEGGRVDGGSATDNKDPKDKSKEEKRFSLNLGDERL